MFEQAHSYPTALAAGPQEPDLAVRTAIRWVLQQQQRLGGSPLVYGPAKANIADHHLLSGFARQPGVEVATWRTIRQMRGWSGPVLAAWPDRTHLAEVSDTHGVIALCVVPWAKGEVDAWAMARRPELLAAAVMPAGPELDPVVEEALKTLTSMVNHSNNLAGSLDHRDAVAVLTTLGKGGYALDAPTIYGWALANGWPARGADRLRDLAVKIGSGRRVQMKGTYPFKPEILEQWRRRSIPEED